MSSRKTLYLIFLAYILLPFVEVLCAVQLSAELIPIFIASIAALGLTVVTGFAGLLHLGIAAFMAIGVYSYAILTCNIYPFQLDFWSASAISTLLGTLCGLALGIPTIRLRGDYLAIVTLGFGEIVQDLLKNLESITKGTQGINPLPSPVLFSINIANQSHLAWYFLALAFLALITLICYRFEYSSFGRAWRAISVDELAAAASSVNIMRTRLFAFAIASGLAALSGALLASFIGSTGEPGNFDFQRSIMVLTMLIVGGLGRLEGALVGTLVMLGINSILLTRLSLWLATQGYSSTASVFVSPNNWKYMLYGLILVWVVRQRPRGLMG